LAISVYLSDRDKKSLLYNYEKLGPKILDRYNDRFLIQSAFSEDTEESSCGTSSFVESAGEVWKKKFHVRFIVTDAADKQVDVKKNVTEEVSSLKKQVEKLQNEKSSNIQSWVLVMVAIMAFLAGKCLKISLIPEVYIRFFEKRKSDSVPNDVVSYFQVDSELDNAVSNFSLDNN